MNEVTAEDIESYNTMLQEEECYPDGYWETLWERCQ